MQKRTQTKILGASIALAAGVLGYVISQSAEIRQSKIVKTDEVQLSVLEEKLAELNESKQQQIRGNVNAHITGKTAIGSVVKALEKVEVEEVENLTLPARYFAYHIPTRKIQRSNTSALDELISYLEKDPTILARAHEKLHAIQHQSSPFYDYSAFIEYIVPGFHDMTEEVKVIMKPEDWMKFSRDVLKRKEWNGNFQEAFTEFQKYHAGYSTYISGGMLLWEMQARIAFQPVITPDALYERPARKEYAKLLAPLSRDQFNELFKTNIELIGMVDPITAAQIVGRSRNLDDFTKSVDELKNRVPDACQKGLKRQEQLNTELENVASYTSKQVMDAIDR